MNEDKNSLNGSSLGSSRITLMLIAGFFAAMGALWARNEYIIHHIVEDHETQITNLQEQLIETRKDKRIIFNILASRYGLTDEELEDIIESKEK